MRPTGCVSATETSSLTTKLNQKAVERPHELSLFNSLLPPLPTSFSYSLLLPSHPYPCPPTPQTFPFFSCLGNLHYRFVGCCGLTREVVGGHKFWSDANVVNGWVVCVGCKWLGWLCADMGGWDACGCDCGWSSMDGDGWLSRINQLSLRSLSRQVTEKISQVNSKSISGMFAEFKKHSDMPMIRF